MGKRRVKQQKISVTGLFKLAGRHKKMDDVFVYHECQSTRWSHSTKNKNKQTQSKTFATSRAFYYVCSFVRFSTCLSYTFCLLVCFFRMPLLYVLSTCSFVCFLKCLSYTFCLVVRFICIKRAVFKHRNRHL